MNGIEAAVRRRLPMVFLGMVVALFAWVGLARAADFTVNDTNDAPLAPESSGCTSTDASGGCTLRAAVQAADAAGGTNTITVPAGTYTLTIAPSGDNDDPSTGDLDIDNDASVTITGAGSGSTVVNANGIDRAFGVQDGAALSISGMTIENGAASADSGTSNVGGAIYNDGGLTITGDVKLVNDTAFTEEGDDQPQGGDGGAIYSDSDTSGLSITGATFSQDNAQGLGGAIYDNSPVSGTISNSTFSSNISDGDDDLVRFDCDCEETLPVGEGGAIFAGGNTGGMTIDTSSFTGNGAGDGSAIYWTSPDSDNAPSLTVDTTSFTSNISGGGFDGRNYVGPQGDENDQGSFDGGTVTDTGSSGMSFDSDQFIDNSGSQGGGLTLDSNFDNEDVTASYSLTHDEFTGNSVTGTGGAIQWLEGSLTISDSSLTSNTAKQGGGLAALNESGDQLSLTNTTISDNTSSKGGGILFEEDDPPTTMLNDTIAFNSAANQDGGGIYDPSSVFSGNGGTGVENTIIAENGGGDCGSPFENSTFNSDADAGHNLDSDGSCFGGLNGPGDQTDVNPLLAHAADNGGPVLTDAESAGSPSIGGANASDCPPQDARGVSRPQGSCDIGAYQFTSPTVSLANSAPSSATANNTFVDTITVSNGGPGSSTGTTVVDPMASGETLWSANPSQGTCSTSGSGNQATCSLGSIPAGSSATITLVVSDGTVGDATNTATLTNDQGASTQSAAVTRIVSAAVPAPAGAGPAPTPAPIVTIVPTKAIGRLLLDSTKLTIRRGKIAVPFTCDSPQLCKGTFSIVIRLKSARTGAVATAVCSNSATSRFQIPAGGKETINGNVANACVALLKAIKQHSMTGKLSSGPRSGQGGVIEKVRLTLGK